MIYTSGTTGNPKGVIIEHRQINNFIVGIKKSMDFDNYSSILCLTTISFDIFILEALLPLLTGMMISIVCNGEDINGDKLSEIIQKNNVEVIQSTPSRLKLLIENENFKSSLDRLDAVLIGGEPVSNILLYDLLKYKELKIYNMYGPTETTIWSTMKQIMNYKEITIGKPISNTKIY
ncbi:AMP-binding protein, partial [Bacillus mobilis]|uniref:AMP-binding protein n=1 Tax=Bacillus mobilis TaxID=2026190 RepID=UPI002FD7A2CC